MTLLVLYPSKKVLKASIGQKLRYTETSAFAPEYKDNGTFAVAYRPTMWRHPDGPSREFFANVTMQSGLIKKVE